MVRLTRLKPWINVHRNINGNSTSMITKATMIAHVGIGGYYDAKQVDEVFEKLRQAEVRTKTREQKLEQDIKALRGELALANNLIDGQNWQIDNQARTIRALQSKLQAARAQTEETPENKKPRIHVRRIPIRTEAA